MPPRRRPACRARVVAAPRDSRRPGADRVPQRVEAQAIVEFAAKAMEVREQVQVALHGPRRSLRGVASQGRVRSHCWNCSNAGGSIAPKRRKPSPSIHWSRQRRVRKYCATVLGRRGRPVDSERDRMRATSCLLVSRSAAQRSSVNRRPSCRSKSQRRRTGCRSSSALPGARIQTSSSHFESSRNHPRSPSRSLAGTAGRSVTMCCRAGMAAASAQVRQRRKLPQQRLSAAARSRAAKRGKISSSRMRSCGA